MTQEDKELLIRDICARLPYDPIVVNKNIDGGYPCELSPYGFKTGIFLDSLKIEDTKIFLRPKSSMTEAEIKELAYKVLQQPDIDIIRQWVFNDTSSSFIDGNPAMIVDWLNAHHFDYRGLIEKGLALEAPEGMYNV